MIRTSPESCSSANCIDWPNLGASKYDLMAEERGLVRAPDSPVWTFPPDSIERLRAEVIETKMP